MESGFIHYGKEPPATDFIKLWVMPTHGIPTLITSWGENDLLATNYNYASAELIPSDDVCAVVISPYLNTSAGYLDSTKR